jgi:Arylsulfotransferase (ASST)
VRTALAHAAAVATACAITVGAQSVYPTGTTIYDPALAWNGYTVLSPLNTQAVIVIDMNGRVVKRWDGFNDSAGGPARVFPGGVVMAASGANPPRQESLEIVQRDFDGNVLWRFDRSEEIQTRDGRTIWSARQHHDWQRDTFPAGYYSPDVNPPISGGNTLILTHTNHSRPAIANTTLEDDRLIEVSTNGDIVWEWLASDHVEEFGFSPAARAAIKAASDAGGGRGGGVNAERRSFDWLHINSATYVGPNRWFDEGDRRFAPDHVIISSRQASFVAIVGRDGRIVWRLGPDFSESKELRAIRQIIGQHHPHLIPKGLPGSGNLLVFDNGGASGYGFTNPTALDGANAFARANSRVLEINPVTLELVWSYAGRRFYSSNISGAQRLPNGNTLITEGASGRLLEVTKEGKIVWEYIYPEFGGAQSTNGVYRGYRLPYAWIPQIPRPTEQAIAPPALGNFRVPGSP